MDGRVAFTLVLSSVLTMTSALPRPGSYYTDEAAHRLLHFDLHSGDCLLFGDSRIVDEILRELASSGSPVAVVEVRELTALISECYKRDPQHKRASPARDFPHILYPGTKWCGTGNAAEDLNDLGPLKALDTCCRDHDLCPDDLDPGHTRHNITNDTPFTMSHCDCNDAFRACLKNEGSDAAKEVGSAFFSTGLFQCYRLAPPTEGCAKWAGMLTQACQEYKFSSTGELRWQVFDMTAFD
ncbi:Phospholipase A2 domain [Trinorchestia longiramus]|nr:Phospholipase A2 domain [Trinorchestia longiramus]